MTGYTDCSCPDCFEIAIGEPGAALCHACQGAGCDQNSSECDGAEEDEPEVERIEADRRAAIAELIAAGTISGFCEACEEEHPAVIDMLLGIPGAFICAACAVDGADTEITPAERGEIGERIATERAAAAIGARLADATREMDAIAAELAAAGDADLAAMVRAAADAGAEVAAILSAAR